MTRRVLGKEKVKEGKAKIPLTVDDPDYANGEYPLNVKYLENDYYEGSDAFGKLLHVYKTFIHCPTIYVYKGIDEFARLTANLYSNNNILNEGQGRFNVENIEVNEDSLVRNGSAHYDYSLKKYEKTNETFVPYGFEYYGVNENYREPVYFDNARIVFVELKNNLMPVSIKTYPVIGAKGETVKLVCRVYNRRYGEVINTPIDIPNGGHLKWYVNGRYITQTDFYENGYMYIDYTIIEDVGVYEWWVEYIPPDEEHYNKGYGANTLAVLPSPNRITATADIPTGQLGQTCTFTIHLSRTDCIEGLRLYIDDHLIHLNGTTAENNYTIPVTSANVEVSFTIPPTATSNNMWATEGTHMVFWEYDDTCTGVTHYQPLDTLLIGFGSIIDFDYIGRNNENPYLNCLDLSKSNEWVPYLRDVVAQDPNGSSYSARLLPIYDSTEEYLQMGRHYFYYSPQHVFDSSTHNIKITVEFTVAIPSAYSVVGLLYERECREPAFDPDLNFNTTRYTVSAGRHTLDYEVDGNGNWTKRIDGTVQNTFTLNDTPRYIGFYTGTANNLYIHKVCIKDVSKNYDTIIYNELTGIPIVTPEILGHISNKEYPNKIANDGRLTLDIEKLVTHISQVVVLERTPPIYSESNYEVDDYANITSILYSNKEIPIPSRTLQFINTNPENTIQTVQKTTTNSGATSRILLNKAGTWKIQTKYPGNKYEYDSLSTTKTINIFKKDTILTLSQNTQVICLNSNPVIYTATLKCNNTPLQNETIKITVPDVTETNVDCTTTINDWIPCQTTPRINTVKGSTALQINCRVYDWTLADYKFELTTDYDVHTELYFQNLYTGWIRLGFIDIGVTKDVQNAHIVEYINEGDYPWRNTIRTNGTEAYLSINLSGKPIKYDDWTDVDFKIRAGKIYATYTTSSNENVVDVFVGEMSYPFWFAMSSWWGSNGMACRKFTVTKYDGEKIISKQTNSEGKVIVTHEHKISGNIQVNALFEETYKYLPSTKSVTTKVKIPVTITIRPAVIYDFPDTNNPHINIQVKDPIGNRINEGEVIITFKHTNTGVETVVGLFDLAIEGGSFNLTRDDLLLDELFDEMVGENALFYTGYTIEVEYLGLNYCDKIATNSPVGIQPTYSFMDVQIMITDNPDLNYYEQWNPQNGVLFEVDHESQTLSADGNSIDMDDAVIMGRAHRGEYIYFNTCFFAQHIMDGDTEPTYEPVGGINYDVHVRRNSGEEQDIANAALNGGTSLYDDASWSRVQIPTNLSSGDEFTIIFLIGKNNSYYHLYNDQYGLKYQFKFVVA